MAWKQPVSCECIAVTRGGTIWATRRLIWEQGGRPILSEDPLMLKVCQVFNTKQNCFQMNKRFDSINKQCSVYQSKILNPQESCWRRSVLRPNSLTLLSGSVFEYSLSRTERKSQLSSLMMVVWTTLRRTMRWLF